MSTVPTTPEPSNPVPQTGSEEREIIAGRAAKIEAPVRAPEANPRQSSSSGLSPNSNQLDIYRSKLTGFAPAPHGRGYIACCPFHHDRHPSFRIDCKNGNWVWYCDVCKVGGGVRRLLQLLVDGSKKQPTATYGYVDPSGKLLFQCLRFEDTDENGERRKTFRQRRPDGHEGWLWNVPPELRTLYNLPAVLDPSNDEIIVVEGEKDVETAKRLQVVGTTNPMGAGKWDPKYSEILRDKDVVIMPDADEPGERHKNILVESLLGKARSVKVVRLPGAKDLTEWAEKGGTSEQLNSLIAAAAVEEKIAQSVGSGSVKSLIVTSAAEIEPEPIEWLWPDHIPLGMLTLFSGNPDLCKSLVSLDVSARTSNGSNWPDGSEAIGAYDVLMFVAEDDVTNTVVPRLIAAGADLKRIHFLRSVAYNTDGLSYEEREFALDEDIKLLREYLSSPTAGAQGNFKLIIIDPLSNYLGKANMNKGQELRRVMAALTTLARETGCAVVSIAHFNKNLGVDAIHKTGGAVELVAIQRMAWGFFKSPDNPDEKLMLPIKGNLTKSKKGLKFRSHGKSIDIKGKWVEVPTVQWLGIAEETADGALAVAADPEQRSIRTVKTWLRDLLSGGKQPARKILDLAEQKGFAEKTVRRAAEQLQVKKSQLPASKAKNAWYWELPAQGDSPDVGLESNLAGDEQLPFF